MIALGCDHGGYELKEIIKRHLEDRNIAYKDFGTHSKGSVDYPKYALAVAESIKVGECDNGILCCGTGIGISIAANKVPGIRAAVVNDCFSAKATKEHNNANVICLGARVVGEGLALMIVDMWLDSEFLRGRHELRIDQISEIEKKYSL